MFERFTQRARQVLVIAQDQAKEMGHTFIGTEHLLLGLVAEGEGVGAKALAACGVSADAVRAQVLTLVGPGVQNVPDKPPFTPRSKKVLELSLKEALGLGHNYIGTEHLLLGLIREGDGVGAQVLKSLDVSLSDVRSKVVDLLAGYTTAKPPSATKRAMQRLRRQKDGRISPGDLLAVMVDEPDSRVTRTLAALGVTPASFAGALAADEEPLEAPPLEIKIGDRTITVDDDDLATRFGDLSEDDMVEHLRRIFLEDGDEDGD